MTPERLFEVLTKYAQSKGTELNADKEFVMEILQGLLRNEERYGYRSCPCRLAKGIKEKDADIICPCAYKDADVAEFGSCYCALYVSKEWNAGTIEHVFVPERRPMEKMQ
ncbi:MAG TPA: ferredoxin-thioredoxin reductase catalytic domain-containing protein [Dissulfurispiraceae bacterium]|nr:ferredoxin-thioredoxin reductase catalytic domain-containing protein [Dissulfurispiraceae bacterium]